jgi:hypothetical protein
MKHSVLVILACVGLAGISPAATNQPPETTPAISLFDSVEKVKAFLKTTAKADYSDKYLANISLKHVAGHPKKGLAWVYSFAFKKPRMGGDVSISHYMDGEIIEFHHGP